MSESAVTRRAALAGALLVPATVALVPFPSWALLPDDDDSELIEKARASRSRRLETELETERRFVKQQGFRDRRGESALKPVQKAVFQLSRSGAALESGNLTDVASILNDGSWIDDFRTVGQKLSAGNGAAERSLGDVLKGIQSLESAAQKGVLLESKKTFVVVVSAITAWASDAGVSGDIQGL